MVTIIVFCVRYKHTETDKLYFVSKLAVMYYIAGNKVNFKSLCYVFIWLLSISCRYSCISICGSVRENRQKNDKNPSFFQLTAISHVATSSAPAQLR